MKAFVEVLEAGAHRIIARLEHGRRPATPRGPTVTVVLLVARLGPRLLLAVVVAAEPPSLGRALPRPTRSSTVHDPHKRSRTDPVGGRDIDYLSLARKALRKILACSTKSTKTRTLKAPCCLKRPAQSRRGGGVLDMSSCDMSCGVEGCWACLYRSCDMSCGRGPPRSPWTMSY